MRHEHTIELIDPPLEIAGERAEFAEVIRLYETNERGEEVQVQVQINVAWGVSMEEAKENIQQKLSAEQAQYEAAQADRQAMLDKLNSADKTIN